MPKLLAIDHVAMTVQNLQASVAFFDRLFGMEMRAEHRRGGIVALCQIKVGDVLLSIHQAGNDVQLVAKRPTVGAVDICFRWSGDIESAAQLLRSHDIEIIDGPSPRTTSDGRPSKSVYFNDPDGNLLELMAAD